MRKIAVILALLFAACFSGGCAVLPALVTTGASFAVPQTVSVAVSAVSTVHKTALIAADERDMNDMVSDKLTTIRAQAALLAETGADVEAQCLDGDVYVVGEYTTPADRESVIATLQKIDGVKSVKGVLKPLPTSLAAIVEPAISDRHAEMVIETGLLKELHIKSANVDVSVVQGEAVIMGVVEDAKEAADVVALVERLRPRTKHPVKVTSLLVSQDDFEKGAKQTNDAFVLLTSSQMLAAGAKRAREAQAVAAAQAPTPVRSETVVAAASVDKPSALELAEARLPKSRTPWQKARLKMKRRILELAKAESDPTVKRRLITLSSRVLKDKYTSIEARLVKTLHTCSNLRVKHYVNDILAEYAPQRVVPIRTVAMN